MKFTMTCVTTHVSSGFEGHRGGADSAARPAIGKTNTVESIWHTGRNGFEILKYTPLNKNVKAYRLHIKARGIQSKI